MILAHKGIYQTSQTDTILYHELCYDSGDDADNFAPIGFQGCVTRYQDRADGLEMGANVSQILLVDDESAVLKALTRVLRRDYRVTAHSSPSEALAALESNDFDIIISDIRMPDMDGYELLQACREKCPDMPRVLLSGYADMEQSNEALENDLAQVILSKPWDNFKLKNMVRLLLELGRLRIENRELKQKLSN